MEFWETLKNDELKRNYWGRVLQKTDRILTGNSEIKLSLDLRADVIGGTDGETIFINSSAPLIKSEYTLLGINYHEVAHLFYTPFPWPPDKNLPHNLIQCWNILEDARIENLLLVEYPRIKPLLIASTNDLMLTGNNTLRKFVLLEGRRYMAKELRDELFRDVCKEVINKPVAAFQRIRAIFTEYISLPEFIPGKMKRLAKELAEILAEALPPVETHQIMQNTHFGQLPYKKGKKLDEQQLQQGLQQIEEESATQPFEQQLKEAQEATQEIVDQMQQAVQKEQKNLDAQVGRDKLKFQYESVNTEMMKLAQRLIKVFAVLRRDLDEFQLNQNSGRFHARSVAQAEANNYNQGLSVFRNFNALDKNKCAFDVVIALDISSSMNESCYSFLGASRWDAACSRLLWVLGYALEQLGCKVMILGFTQEAYTLKTIKDVLSKGKFAQYQGQGGTSPRKTFEDMENVFKASRRPKLGFVLTDGEWAGGMDVFKKIKRNYPVYALGLGYKASHVINVSSPDKVYKFCKKVLIEVEKQAVRGLH